MSINKNYRAVSKYAVFMYCVWAQSNMTTLAHAQSSANIVDIKSQLSSKDRQERVLAVESLLRSGSAASDFSADLVALLSKSDNELATLVQDAIVACGAKGIDALAIVVTSDDIVLKKRALVTLTRIRRDIRRGGELIILDLISDRSEDVRCAAIAASCKLEPQVDDAVPILIQIASRENGFVQCIAISALGDFSSKAADAEKLLIKLFSDRKEQIAVRRIAATSLLKGVCKNANLGKILAERLVDPSEPLDLRKAAAYLLSEYPRVGQPEVDKIAKVARDVYLGHEPFDRIFLEDCLISVSKLTPLPDSLKTLSAIARDRNVGNRARTAAVQAIGQLGPDAKGEVAFLIETISPSNLSAFAAVSSLVRILPEAEANQELRNALKRIEGQPQSARLADFIRSMLMR